MIDLESITATLIEMGFRDARDEHPWNCLHLEIRFNQQHGMTVWMREHFDGPVICLDGTDYEETINLAEDLKSIDDVTKIFDAARALFKVVNEFKAVVA